MATIVRSPMKYLQRQKILLRNRNPRPLIQPLKMRTHQRPHAALPELQPPDSPVRRLNTVPIEQVPEYIDLND